MASEPSVFYYTAIFALQAFLILLKQNKYGTDAGENKCSLKIKWTKISTFFILVQF